uniref:Uncharacterized protein n=1 Tax=Vespula pensylvanica TaxID=30213 RepID=A0A834P856_VESPE|nr:hypothetical protein H0235_004885 [Vespula pensylvanica]
MEVNAYENSRSNGSTNPDPRSQHIEVTASGDPRLILKSEFQDEIDLARIQVLMLTEGEGYQHPQDNDSGVPPQEGEAFPCGYQLCLILDSEAFIDF